MSISVTLEKTHKVIVEEIKRIGYGACNVGRITCDSCPITRECEVFHNYGEKVQGGSEKSIAFKKKAIKCWENNCK